MLLLAMKFIYFDVGGVLMKDLSNINDAWGKLLYSLGLKKDKRKDFDRLFEEVFEKEFDLGNGIKEFREVMKSDFGIKLSKNYSISDDLVNRFFHKNKGLEKIVKKIKEQYNLGLLTNMYDGMLNLIRKKGLIPIIDWKVIVDSSVEKCRKPDKRIYRIAQKRSGFEDKEILFIDNKKENLEVPKKMGWQTHWYDSSDYEKSNYKLVKILKLD